MKKVLIFALFLMLVSSTITITLPNAFAERNSVFQKIEDFIQEPFLSLEKAAGGDGQNVLTHINNHKN